MSFHLFIKGPNPNNILSDQTEISELNTYREKELQEDPNSVDVDPSEDMGLTIRIQVPGTEPTDFQVNCFSCIKNWITHVPVVQWR